MHKRPATMADVAKLSGRSSATISRHINNTGVVSPEAARAIDAAIEQLGYVPSASARGLANRYTGMIGLCLPAIGPYAEFPTQSNENSIEFDLKPDVTPSHLGCDSYFNEIVRGAEFAAWEIGSAITITVARGENAAARVRDMASRVDGMVVLGEALSPELLDHVTQRVPVVILSDNPHPLVKDYICADNNTGIKLLVNHLINSHNITDLTFVAGRESAFDDRERFIAFREALEEAGLEAPESVEYRADFHIDYARELGVTLARTLDWSADAPQRAFVCSNDDTAVGLAEAFIDNGISVPGQAALTGFDDCRVGKSIRPRITSVRQATMDLGALAVEALHRRIQDPECEPQNVSYPITVVVRESCGDHS